MSDYLGDVAATQTVTARFTTEDASGAPITLAGTPAARVRKGSGSGTTITAGVTLTVDVVTGQHVVDVDLTASASYTAGADYAIELSAGTVGGVSVVGKVLGTFSIANRLASDSSGVTTLLGKFTGITLLAQWLGLIAGKQVGNSTARTELRATGAGSGTFDETTDALEALRDSMGTAQTGDAFARLGAPAGASVSADVASVKSDTAAIKTDVESTGVVVASGSKTGYALTSAYDPAKTAAQAGDAMALTSGERTTLAASIWNALTSGMSTAGSIGKRIVDFLTGDVYARIGTPAGASVSADVAAVKTDTASIISTLAGMAAAAATAVWAAGTRTLTAFGFTPSLDPAYDAAKTAATQMSVDDLPTNAELATALAGADDAVLAAIAALNNLSQANIRTAIGLASANLDTQLDALPTNAELAAALAGADDAVLAAIAALNNLSQANVRAAVGLASANLDTQLDALPTNAELATAIAAADDAVLAAIAALGTVLDSVKAQTDLIPASPAAVGDIPTAVDNADALLKRDFSAVTGEAARSALNALRFLRNKWSIAGGILTVTKENDSTAAWTSAVTQTAGDPVSASDPA